MSKLLQFRSDFRRDSEFVYKTVPLGINRGGACAVLTHVARKPLRHIVARFPVTFEHSPDSGYFLTYYLDTLSCGHQVVTYSHEQARKRRGCADCAEIQIAIPFPKGRAA